MSASDQEPKREIKVTAAATHKKTVRSEDLFGGAREVIIVHGDAEYRLQRTKAGKLILTK